MDSVIMRRSMDLPRLADRSIKLIGANSLVAGIGMSLFGPSVAADFLIAGGLLFLLAARFADWWEGD